MSVYSTDIAWGSKAYAPILLKTNAKWHLEHLQDRLPVIERRFVYFDVLLTMLRLLVQRICYNSPYYGPEERALDYLIPRCSLIP